MRAYFAADDVLQGIDRHPLTMWVSRPIRSVKHKTALTWLFDAFAAAIFVSAAASTASISSWACLKATWARSRSSCAFARSASSCFALCVAEQRSPHAYGRDQDARRLAAHARTSFVSFAFLDGLCDPLLWPLVFLSEESETSMTSSSAT